jgi:uncharacterized protein
MGEIKNEVSRIREAGDQPACRSALRYLVGIVHFEERTERFAAYWARNRADEKSAFENTVDFMTARLATYPAAHI